jgi:hypothetical protein
VDLFFNLLQKGVATGLLSIGRITLILVPVLVLLEIARHYQFLEKVSEKVKGLLHVLTLPKEASFPLVVGMIFGIVLGAALIIDYAREGYLQKRDLLLIGIFLSINHSVIEDTFIFAAFGANPLILLCTRLFLAVLITRLAAGGFAYLARRKKSLLEKAG